MVANKDSMMRVLWCKEIKWQVKGLHVKKRVQKSNVDALFLQLIALKILVLKKEGAQIVWMLGRFRAQMIPGRLV